MFDKLIKLADRYDAAGKPEIANKIDRLIVALAQQAGGNINLVELMRLKPETIMSLGKAISFDLVLEPDPDGRGNTVRAIPKIHDKWTDGLNLGDISNTPELQTYMMPAAADETIKQLEEGGWFEEGADLPWASEEDVKFAPETLREIQLENLEKGRQTQKQRRDIDEALSGAVQEVERESFLPESERSEEAQQYDLPTIPPSGFSYEPEYRKQQEKERREERKRMREPTEAEVRAALVKMADEFDQEGKFDLASEIDRTLMSFSARPKAPLKKLDDKVKKNLIVFVHDADQNNSKSIKGLNELFRRLRYFDFADSAKDLGLDKIVKDMEKTQEGLEAAKRRFFELMHGKKPSKKDLEDMFKEIVDAARQDDGQNTLDFFEANSDDGWDQDAEDSAIDKEIPAEEMLDIPEGEEEISEEEMSEEMMEELEKFLEAESEEGDE